MSPAADQAEHDVLRAVLSRFLVAEVASSRGAGGCGRVVCGAVATLDSLLAAHLAGDRGRCWSCRGPGWLRQPTHRVQAHLASELGIQFVPLTIAFGRKALPGDPPDPDQICPDCLRKVSAQ